MYRNTVNRNVDKYVNALKVYCDRSQLDKANAQLENLYQALDELMQVTKARVEARSKPDVRPEAKRQTESTGSDKPPKKGKSVARQASRKVPSKVVKSKS